MKLGLPISTFTWSGGREAIGPRLAELARAADDAGFGLITVMDHFFQIPNLGPWEDPMLEGYTALTWIAAATRRARVGTMVTGVTYRHPAVLVKQVTALDVLSGGRAMLGIGAAWFDREHQALGVPFPPLKERFERLEETLQIALQMWDENNNGPYQGTHYQLTETLNHPQALSRPHPPILVGGGGEQKTLRLVAQYADACNLFGGPDPAALQHKLDVLKGHCDAVGRDYDTIEKTVMAFLGDPGERGETAGPVVAQLEQLAAMGVDTVLVGQLRGDARLSGVERLGRHVVPQIADR